MMAMGSSLCVAMDSFDGSICETQLAAATIEGTINIEGGTTAYFSRVEGNQVTLADSASTDKKGHFKIDIELTKPTMYLLKFKGRDNAVLHLMLESGDKLNLTLEDLQDIGFIHVTKASGSRNIEVYQQFNNILFEHSQKLGTINQEYAMPSTTENRKRELSLLFQQEMAAQNNDITKLLSDNSDALICSFLVTYFDEDAEQHIALYEKIYESQKGKYSDNQFVQYVEGKLRSTIGPGRMAPEIEMNDPNGVTRKLSDLRGKVVMIDFWASWCSPCRMENPNVVKLYKKYRDKGFDIYSVSLDRTRDAWVNAIQQDGLEWPNHVSDLRGWTSSGGATYGIRSVPSTVLVDRDGRIIARNLRGQELANKLKEIFGE